MRIPSYRHLTLAVLLLGICGRVPPTYADQVHCGDVLDGRFTLDADLTCGDPGSTNPNAVGLILIDGGLNLNGHTLTCASSQMTGIRVSGPSVFLRTGTVTGCRIGVYMEGESPNMLSMTLSHNYYGVVADVEASLFFGNTAIDNVFAGFGIQTRSKRVQPGRGNRIFSNTASGNGYGFILNVKGATIQGNSATSNATGFAIGEGRDTVVSGNLAEHNDGSGFEAGGPVRLTLENNTALRNGGPGFLLTADGLVRGNASQENQGDGFAVVRSPRIDLTNNVASRNGRNGIHVSAGTLPKHFRKTSHIHDNAAFGEMYPYFALTDDDPQCRVTAWHDNNWTGGVSPDCIN